MEGGVWGKRGARLHQDALPAWDHFVKNNKKKEEREVTDGDTAGQGKFVMFTIEMSPAGLAHFFANGELRPAAGRLGEPMRWSFAGSLRESGVAQTGEPLYRCTAECFNEFPQRSVA
jgi:hypothetical protein